MSTVISCSLSRALAATVVVAFLSIASGLTDFAAMGSTYRLGKGVAPLQVPMKRVEEREAEEETQAARVYETAAAVAAAVATTVLPHPTDARDWEPLEGLERAHQLDVGVDPAYRPWNDQAVAAIDYAGVTGGDALLRDPSLDLLDSETNAAAEQQQRVLQGSGAAKYAGEDNGVATQDLHTDMLGRSIEDAARLSNDAAAFAGDLRALGLSLAQSGAPTTGKTGPGGAEGENAMCGEDNDISCGIFMRLFTMNYEMNAGFAVVHWAIFVCFWFCLCWCCYANCFRRQ